MPPLQVPKHIYWPCLLLCCVALSACGGRGGSGGGAQKSTYTIDANALSVGSRLLLVGILRLTDVPGATPGSGLVVGGFTDVPINVTSQNSLPSSSALSSLAASPAALRLAPGKTEQLALTGTHSGGSAQDLTTEASWSSSDASEATVSDTGLVRGVAVGAAVLTAHFSDLMASAQTYVTGTGQQVGTFSSTAIPANSGQSAYYLPGGTLSAMDQTTQSARWAFAGDGKLDTAPILIDSVVVIGSASGTVYALDAATGSVLWSEQAAAAISGPDEHDAIVPRVALGAGDGYVVVPSGDVVNARKLVP